MKLGEALSELKREKSGIARLVGLRKDNVYVEKGKSPAFDPQKLTEEINKKMDSIRKLKISIQRTNLETKLTEKNITLAEAILKINDLRSTIGHLSKLFEEKSSYLYREKEAKEKVPLLNECEIEEKIKSVEAEKVQLDNLIQVTNWTVDVLK